MNAVTTNRVASSQRGRRSVRWTFSVPCLALHAPRHLSVVTTARASPDTPRPGRCARRSSQARNAHLAAELPLQSRTRQAPDENAIVLSLIVLHSLPAIN